MEKFIIVNGLVVKKSRIDAIGIIQDIYIHDRGTWKYIFNIYIESGKSLTIEMTDNKKLKQVRDDLVESILNSHYTTRK